MFNYSIYITNLGLAKEEKTTILIIIFKKRISNF